MGLLSFLQRKSAGPEPESVDLARLRARRRLIGAVVLVAMGVVGFPLLFDTSPRPVAPGIPIELAGGDAASRPAAATPPAEAVVMPPQFKNEAPTARAADAGRDAAASPAPASAPAPTDRVADKPAAAATEKAAPAGKPAPAPAGKPTPAPTVKARSESARAQAALEGKPANANAGKPASPKPDPNDAAERFVVQVGAFSEAGSASELRQRVEKLGLRAYTQAVDTAAGKRIRVRVGPYGERGEADRAAARLKQAGLQPAVLTL